MTDEFTFDPAELFMPVGPGAPSWGWKPVQCYRCGKRYRCTPNSDYFTTVRNTVPKNDSSGFCWDCMCIVSGLTPERAAAGKGPQPEPALGDPEFRLRPPFL